MNRKVIEIYPPVVHDDYATTIQKSGKEKRKEKRSKGYKSPISIGSYKPKR